MTPNSFRWLLAALVLGGGLHVDPAEAQDRPRLQILIENLNEDAAKCGVTETSLDSEAALVLRNNGILTTEDSNPYLYLNVTVVLTGSGICAVNTSAQLKTGGQRVQAGAFRTRPNRFASLVFCDDGVLQTWPRGGRGKPNVELVIKTCLGKLEY